MKVKVLAVSAHDAEPKLQAWFDANPDIKLQSMSTAIEDGYLHVTIIYSDLHVTIIDAD